MTHCASCMQDGDGHCRVSVHGNAARQWPTEAANATRPNAAPLANVVLNCVPAWRSSQGRGRQCRGERPQGLPPNGFRPSRKPHQGAISNSCAAIVMAPWILGPLAAKDIFAAEGVAVVAAVVAAACPLSADIRLPPALFSPLLLRRRCCCCVCTCAC